MSGTLGRKNFHRSFGICPLFLTGGVAATFNTNILPIIALTQAADFQGGVMVGTPPADLNDYFAQFDVMPGGTLADNAIGEYPFANQAIAANAIIAQPLKISVQMICPLKANGSGYLARQTVISAMQSTIAQHTSLGGTWTVCTPAFTYTACILKRLVDISTGETEQRQFRLQFDFEQPLVTLAAAQSAQNTLLQKITNGVQTDGTQSGPNVTTGNSSSNSQPYQGAQAGSPYSDPTQAGGFG